MTRTLSELLCARADAMPDAVAVGFLTHASCETLSYAALATRAAAIARLLRDQGCRAGDRVLLLVPPGLDYIAAFFGCLLAGAIAVPSYPPRGGRALQKVAHILLDSGARLLLLPERLDGPLLRAALPADCTPVALEHAADGGGLPNPDGDAEAPAFLQYTSGSTSSPKGVVLSHRAVLANLAQIAHAFGHSADSVGVNWLPPFHDMGLIGTILQPIFVGFPTYLMSPLEFVQRPARWLTAIARYRATTVGAPNFAFELCTDRVPEDTLASLDLSSVRVLFCGAEPIRADTLARFQRRFAGCGLDSRVFFPCYGLAEATLYVSGVARGSGFRTRSPNGGTRAYVACGPAAAGTELCIVDPERRRTLHDGEIGEVWLRGASLASGYWRQPEASDATFRAALAGDPSGRHWLRTGDLGFLADGELYPTGRLKDILILAGRKLSAEELEHTALIAVGSGADRAAVAYAVADRGGTEAAALLIELADQVDGDLTLDACERWGRSIRDAVAQEHDIGLSELHLVRRGELLRTTSGKVERGANRDAARSGNLALAASWRAGRWSLGASGLRPKAEARASKDGVP